MMTIDRIEPMVRQEHTFRVHLSDGSVLKIMDCIIADLALYVGMELDERAMKELREAVGRESAKSRAVRIISAAGVSQKELYRRLVQKGETEKDALEAVHWLAELHLLDDCRMAEQLVDTAVRKGYGKNRIQQILYEKGIPEEFWEAALSNLPPMDHEVDRFLQTRWKGKKPDKKEWKRAADALLRRGHSWSDIRAGIRRYSDDLDADLEGYDE